MFDHMMGNPGENMKSIALWRQISRNIWSRVWSHIYQASRLPTPKQDAPILPHIIS